MIARLWQQYSEKFEERTRRERVILLVAVLAVIYLLWSLIFLGPVSDRLSALQKEKQRLAGEVQSLETQEQVFQQAVGQDPLAGKKRQVEHLRERLAALDADLQALAVGLIPADKLPQMLHDVLSSAGQLELLGMQTLPTEKLALREADQQATAEGGSVQEVDVYRHAVELKVRGSYFAVARYLEALEALPWRFYWESLDYQVERYPSAVATLKVYTLSAGEGPLGQE
jgi:MSHA biogenesis protein MshJ